MGGKSGTTTQSVSIPPEVLKRYNAVNAQAEQVAKTPFQPYTGQFVAGITPTQQAGIAATGQYAQAAQPYYQAATGQLGQAQGQGQQAIQQAFGSLGQGVDVGQQYAQAATGGIGEALQFAQPYMQGATGAAMAGSQAITPDNINIQGYMSPYTQAVADTTYQALRQQQQQEMQGATANAIKSGAFGGDRAGLVAANLARQQQLGTAQAMAPIYQQGYGQALGTAMTAAQSNRAALQNLSQQLQGIGQAGYGQQMGAAQQLAGLGQQQFGQGLGAAQQLGALGQQQYGMGAGTAQQLAALGTGAQAAGLQGAQAQLGAGTLEQQTQQADLTARYQQFLQERGYPFQVAQFLANIAMGTGALSGSTTTTTQPMPFFSDRRVKHDVKEIGKTHDGQPIYSFKYNGEKATRIGLMAQDVEKKHPEAVYDMDGIKGVDYEEATKDSARPERYAGGLVPASMGGAVTEPGAYNRGGYAIGGDVIDPNDLQAILSQQQEAFGPFSEGGIYGGSQHQAPYMAAKGIVPQSRMHVPKLQTPGAPPPLPESGAQQMLSAYDSAMGMKKRYDEAKGLLAKKPTAQEEEDKSRRNLTTKDDVKNLAGPDIKAPASKEDEGILDYISSFFKADGGGVVPRSRYAIGGSSKDPSLPYEEDDKTPYKYFPTEILETEKPELAKPSQPPAQTSQSGIGLGTLLGLFLKDGGVVPRGHLQTGGVYDPTMGEIVKATELTPEKIAELNKEDVYSRELQPAAAPRFRTFERIAAEEGAKGLKPNELYRSPERSAILDMTMPEGAPRAKPYGSGHNYGLAVDYSNTVPSNYDAMRRAAAKTGLTLGLEFKNVDPPHVQLGKGGYGGLYGKDVVIDEGFGQRSQSGVVPEEAVAGAYERARQIAANLPSTKTVESSGSASGVMPSMKAAQDWLAANQGWLSPLGSGIRGMVQSRSPFLGAAVLEGVGTGLEAVGPTQQRLADIGLTRAQTFKTGSEVPAGYVYIGMDANGRPMYALRSELLTSTVTAPTEPLAETQKQVVEQAQTAVTGEQPPAKAEESVPAEAPAIVGPVTVSGAGANYRHEVNPTSVSERNLNAILEPWLPPALKGKKLNPYAIADVVKGTDYLAELEQGEQERVKMTKDAAKLGEQKLRDLKMLSTNINKISGDEFTSTGPNYEGRQALAYLANWTGNYVLGNEFQSQDWNQDITSGAIVNKLRTQLGPQAAGSQGIRAGFVAEALSDASPSGAMPKDAANEILASMFVSALAERDFDKFSTKYGKFGTALGVNDAFRAEFDPIYTKMKPLIKAALEPVMLDGKVTSPAMDLMNGVITPEEFDRRSGMPGLSRVFLGG